MAYSDLRDFIAALEKNNELKRIPFEVDPYLEITEFADRAVKGGGPALLFEKPKGSNVPVLINSFASARKMEMPPASRSSWKCACPRVCWES
jgi:4-hydroxy-3-polyprenylbenzoate decarboxylase